MIGERKKKMVYYFKFEAKPAEGNRYYGKTGYGEADIFVSGDGCNDDLDTMESIARAYIIAQTWVATKLVEIRETNPPAPDWDKELVALYQSALHSGVSGFFVAAPDSDIPRAPMLRVRPY